MYAQELPMLYIQELEGPRRFLAAADLHPASVSTRGQVARPTHCGDVSQAAPVAPVRSMSP
jgi:hypothetical protein